ncbi:hypothetical protein [Bacillus solitudinis]|uniref:hypothetical protein n=1 Tax=Bacillus solitudinis TaxID=2014074 RepID=UPI0018E25D8E|nr:hypothetical protein [Bacillus solitudinis]
MKFKNKLTGLVWDVVDADHIKRCEKDKNYEEVKVEKPKPTSKTTTTKRVSKAKPKE